MAETDPRQTTTTSMKTDVSNFKVAGQVLDTPATNEETYWDNRDFSKYLGYYKTIPELKKAIDALIMWAVGKGWDASDIDTKARLDNIDGSGNENFTDIIRNHLVIKKLNGDAYIEIVKDKLGQLINLKNLNPATTRTVYNKKGIIIGYDLMRDGEVYKRLNPDQVIHSMNDRVGNEIHGVSVIEACQWVIDARNEAMADKRRIMHRSTIRVLEVDADDTTTLNTLKTQYATAVKNGEVMIVPKGNVGFPDVPPLSTAEHSEWIRYLESFFYQAVGISKTILGGTEEFTEAGSKVGMLVFEQPYRTEMEAIEQDLWNQAQIRVTFRLPVSLKDEMGASEAANTGQVGIQPTDSNVGVTRQ